MPHITPTAPGLRIVSAPHAQAQALACDRAVEACLAAGVPVARIAPTAELAALTARRLADTGTGTLGVPTTTLQAWALDRWSLYGDGRRPVSGPARRAAAAAVLDDARTRVLAAALPGMASCVEGVVRVAAGSAAFDGTRDDDARLSPVELELLAVCRSYERLLSEHGLIEPGRAMSLLPSLMGAAGWAHLVLDGHHALTDAELGLAAAAACRRGATLVAELGPNPACAAARELAAHLEEACRAQGAPVERTDCRELLGGEVPDPRAPWASAEVADLAGRLFTAGVGPALEARGDVRFCLPSGRYAEPELLARTLRSLVAEGVAPRAVAVACKDPVALAGLVAPRLAETAGRAVACRAQGSAPVASTGVGRLLAALVALVEAEREQGDEAAPDLRACASDIARNPLAGLTTDDALDLDRAWRGDRTVGAATVLHDLCVAAERAAVERWLAETEPCGASDGPRTPLAEAVGALRCDDLAGAAAALVKPLGTAGSTERLERAAAARVARLDEARKVFGVRRPLSQAGFARLVAGAAVPVSWVSVAAGDVAAQESAAALDSDPNAVAFCSLAQLQGRSFEAVVVCDLTAEDASVGDRTDAQEVFLDALGVGRGPSALQELRRRLMSAVEAARSCIVFERCLQDPDARGMRPSALFEEVVDCYRADPTAGDDLDRITGLPKGGALPSATLGEERFAELASPSTWTPAAIPAEPTAVLLRPDRARRLYLCDDHVWTPSALEAYLSCPLRWFYEFRLPSGGIDAEFGPRELGSFSRRVLGIFHEAMARRGVPRVEGAADRAEWEPVLDACFDRALDERAGSNPLVPVTLLEHERLNTVRRNLRGCVERDALLPQGFAPSSHEWSFGDREPLVYGGVRLHGTVDRVDEDGAGHALVIGYRGAVGESYGIPRPKRGQDPAEVDRLPQHCQALVYASVLQQARPDTAAVGALYVSYNRARIKGFLDGAAACLAGSDLGEDNVVARTDGGGSGFQDLLCYLEQEVARAMDRLRDGDTAPNPRFGKDSCAYCTVTGCPKRRTA